MQRLMKTGLLLAALLAVASPVRAADSYVLDPMHTSVTWTINHFGFSNPWGKFTIITGTLDLDEQNPVASRLSVTIPMEDLFTGLPKLDEHLKSDQFFDVAQYPTATFVSTHVAMTGKNTATVTGDLTMHGVTHPESLVVTLNKIGENMFKKKTAGFSATADIKRSDFGMTTYLPALGDHVKLYIEAEANLP